MLIPMAENQPPAMNVLRKSWLAWFIAYFALGSLAMMQHQTSFLAAPVDHVDSFWLKVIFLNVPLQLVLVLVSLRLTTSPKRVLFRAGVCTSLVVTVLISANLVTAVTLELFGSLHG